MIWPPQIGEIELPKIFWGFSDSMEIKWWNNILLLKVFLWLPQYAGVFQQVAKKNLLF